MHRLKCGRTCHIVINVVNKRNKWGKSEWDMSLSKDNVSKNGKLAHVIELRIRIDKEDFMHDINQHEVKMDG